MGSGSLASLGTPAPERCGAMDNPVGVVFRFPRASSNNLDLSKRMELKEEKEANKVRKTSNRKETNSDLSWDY